MFPPSNSNYVNIKGLEEHGYVKMPEMEESLAGYLASRAASLWKGSQLWAKYTW